ncbi:MAG TPA: TlpA disulfide reductase family protein [Actinomycetota bacterium]|nr:TlpA disulfide reductase family protein [Actinomycetota bacterium]
MATIGTEEGHATRGGRSWGRVALILVPCVLFLGLLGYGLLQTGSAPQPGDQAPAFEGELLSGDGTLALDDLEGRPVFINFWWSGCAPCKDEAPALKRAAETYGDEVAFVGINIRDLRDDAVRFAEEYELDYPHIFDDSLTIYRDYGLTGQPESFFIDRNGEIVEHVAGPIDETGLNALLDVLVTRGG